MRLSRCVYAVLLSAACLLHSPTSSYAGQFYANGNNINLASGRSNSYSSSGNLGGSGVLAPLYPQYGGVDFRANYSTDGPYWQVNFPTPYKVSDVYVETYDNPYGMNTMNFQTTTDGTTWTTQASPAVVGTSFNASFAPVSGVVGVRLVSTTWDDNSYPGIFRAVRITGPNTTLPVNNATYPAQIGKSEFSVAQATWNGGSIQSAPGWSGYSGAPVTAAIDDYTTGPWNFNQTIFHTTASDPAPIDLLLNDNYLIDSVAVVTGNEIPGRTTQAVDIYYSPDISSPFIPILTNVSLTGNPLGYYVIPLGGSYDSRRLRFDFAVSSAGSDTFIAELYAFATFNAVPEPSTFALLGLGVIGLAVKTRRRRV